MGDIPKTTTFAPSKPKQKRLMKYKLLVLDLDGTLTNAKKEITPRNREALIRVQQQGVKLILASGRPTFGIAPLADELRMKEFGGFILSYNGGEIIDWSTGEIVYANVLPDEVIPRLYECATRNQLPILTYDRQYIITEYPDDVYVRKEAFLNKMQIYPSKDFLKDIRLPLPKCLIVGEPHRLIPIEAELSVELQGQLSVYRSEPFFLELVPQGIDKAQSLSVLLNKLNMNREEIVAVGDGYNDLSMIQFAGLGVAMGNAQEPVKKAADYITLSNEEDGVAALNVTDMDTGTTLPSQIQKVPQAIQEVLKVHYVQSRVQMFLRHFFLTKQNIVGDQKIKNKQSALKILKIEDKDTENG